MKFFDSYCFDSSTSLALLKALCLLCFLAAAVTALSLAPFPPKNGKVQTQSLVLEAQDLHVLTPRSDHHPATSLHL